MARLPAAQREDLPKDEQHFYDRIILTRGAVAGPFTVLLRSPDVAARVANVGAFVRFESVLPARAQTLVALLAAREYDCEYEWSAWVPQARDAGIRETLITDIGARKEPAGLTKEEGLIIDFCRQLLRGNHHVSEATYRATIEYFGVAAAVQIAVTLGYLVMLAFTLNAFQVDPIGDGARLPA